MKLVKTPPTIATLKQDLDTLFERLWRGPLFPELAPSRAVEPVWEPALDFSETDKEYIVRLEVPGFHKENLDVKLENGLLTLSGHRELKAETKGENFIWQEREEGRFLRTLRLPTSVQEEKIEARYTDGVLTVHLPKVEPTAKARISIK
jgi:HSP20 family protein